MTLKLDGKEHDLAIGYVAETPVWRPSYRVVIDKNGQAELQSWGIIENLSGENWTDIDLVLVAGAPLAFQSNLGQPVTPQRPLVSDSGEVIDAMPEGVTSVAENKGPVDRYEPEAATPVVPAPGLAPEELESAARDEEKRTLGHAATRAAQKSTVRSRSKKDEAAYDAVPSSAGSYAAGMPATYQDARESSCQCALQHQVHLAM